MDRAAGVMLAGTRRDVAANRLVLIVPPAAAVGAPALTSLADLAMPRIERVAMGNPPSVTAGRYAKGALERANLWTASRPVPLRGRCQGGARHVVRGEAARASSTRPTRR
jgi:molybdate transport system substrate-binding protein